MLIKVKRSQYKDPDVELVARLLDRARSEGTVNSVVNENKSVIGMHEGFYITFLEEDDGFTGLAYRKQNGRDFNLKTGVCKSRDEAGRKIFKYIRAFNK